MDERLRFVARLLEGEKMAPLCAEFGISRKTGYKIFDRYKDCGFAAFTDRSRRPYRQANRLPPQLEAVIVRLEAGVSRLGGAEDPRKAAAAVDRAAPARDQHGARGA
jgi:putative transposase